MAKLEYVVFGDVQSMGPTVLNNPKLILEVFNIPGSFSFSVIVAISDLDVARAQHNFEFVLKNEDNEEISSVSGDNIEIDRDSLKNVPNEFSGFFVSLGMNNVVFQKEGVYTGYVTFDGDFLGESRIYVMATNHNEG